MRDKPIRLFMWPYQSHFRSQFERLTNDAIGGLGVQNPGIECLLVGARVPGRQNRNAVCVDPEDGHWPLVLFDRLPDQIEQEIANRPLQNVAFWDAPSARDKPENIRRDSVRKAVEKALLGFDETHEVWSAAGTPVPVGDHYVVPVLQVPKALFRRFRTLPEPPSFSQFHGYQSLIHASVAKTLAEARDELLRPDPGRYPGQRTRSPAEIARSAASAFMYTPGIVMQDRHFSDGLFERLNSIASLMYEGSKGTGRFILTRPDNPALNMWLTFENPVPLQSGRWSRKLLQLAFSDAAIIVDCEKAFGLGSIDSGTNHKGQNSVFEVEFFDRYTWRLLFGNDVMLISKNGTPSLPREKYPTRPVLDTYRRLFPEADKQDRERFRCLIDAAVAQEHGSLLVVARDADGEANRLQDQGTKIRPTALTPSLYAHASRIDGAILMDPRGICYAIGVILDGPARPGGTPSRGARYNSGLRYVCAVQGPRLAVVVSDDDTVDVIPILRQQIDRSSLDVVISDLESGLPDNYEPALDWLQKHRFYVNQEQCDRINVVLRAIDDIPLEVGEIRLRTPKFAPNPNMNESYFKDEGRQAP